MTTSSVESIDSILPEAPKADLKKRLFVAIKLIVSVSLIFYLVKNANIPDAWKVVTSASMSLILLSFSLHGLGYFSSAYRWRLLLLAQGYDVSVPYLMRSYAIGGFFNNFLPSTIGGDGYRAYDTSKCNIPRLNALASVLVERFLGLFALVIFAILSLALAAELTTQIDNLWVWSLVTFFAMSTVTWLIFSSSQKLAIPQKLSGVPGMNLVSKLLAKITDAFAPFKGKSKTLVWAMAWSFLLQLNVIFHYYLISEALSLEIPFVKYLVIIPFSMFVQMIPVSINGIGVRESFYVFFLTRIYGVPIESTLAFTWIAYAMILLLGLMGGVIYAFRR